MGSLSELQEAGLLSLQKARLRESRHEFNAVNDLGRLDVEIDVPITPAPPNWAQITLAG